ncbi:MAG: hypothetical protein CYG61_09980 [Actinobacteria bacterium]|nr:MAG: hypothetical protein CYG61_09980 [Actinomycetota bacterium]
MIPAADEVSLTLVRRGRAETAAYTGEIQDGDEGEIAGIDALGHASAAQDHEMIDLGGPTMVRPPPTTVAT